MSKDRGKDRQWRPATEAVRSGRVHSGLGEHSDALFLTSSFMFNSAAQAAARFAEEEPGFIYSRFSNPTVEAFQNRLAALERAENCIATASGMSAVLACFLGVCKSGDRIATTHNLFGASVTLLDNFISKFGVAVDYLDDEDAKWEDVIRDDTRLVFIETPSNPTMRLYDIAALAEVAHARGALLAVDNCFCTPVLQRPLELGADLVIHSMTKYLDGQGRTLGGAVLGSAEVVNEKIFPFLRCGGPSLSPFNAWVGLKGLETLPTRMAAHARAGDEIARWLEQHPKVRQTLYPGLASHPQREIAVRQHDRGEGGGLVTFTVDGGRDAAWRVIDGTELFSITANFGDTRSTITHPASTTHRKVSPEIREALGISEDLLRISVGLEDLEDIREDLERALGAI